MNAPETESLRLESTTLRLVCAGTGAACLALGVAGVFLPLLPTTPFVLLAAACFARSSRRLDRWLHEHKLFGPVVREWRLHRAMPYRAKRLALLMLACSMTASIVFIDDWRARLALAGLGLVLGAWLWRIPSRDGMPAVTGGESVRGEQAPGANRLDV